MPSGSVQLQPPIRVCPSIIDPGARTSSTRGASRFCRAPGAVQLLHTTTRPEQTVLFWHSATVLVQQLVSGQPQRGACCLASAAGNGRSAAAHPPWPAAGHSDSFSFLRSASTRMPVLLYPKSINLSKIMK
jgi:hypothetical protein